MRSIRQPADLPPDWRMRYEERAAIMEWDGKLPKAEAERNALRDILQLMQAGQKP